jgi:hypothetical protein
MVSALVMARPGQHTASKHTVVKPHLHRGADQDIPIRGVDRVIDQTGKRKQHVGCSNHAPIGGT